MNDFADWGFPDETADEGPRPRIRACRFGLGLIALALGLLCLSNMAFLSRLFGQGQAIGPILSHPLWRWGLGATIPWAALVGSYLLWGRWSDGSWQWRAGLLVLLNGVDAGLWVLDNALDLGLKLPSLERHQWFTFVLTLGTGWLELGLTASLAAEALKRIGHQPPEGVSVPQARAWSLVAVGLVLWAMIAFGLTRWWDWPMLPRMGRGRGGDLRLLVLLSVVMQTILTFQVTAQALGASRLCRKALETADHPDMDLLKSRSEQG
jgi:hypothetical protein